MNKTLFPKVELVDMTDEAFEEVELEADLGQELAHQAMNPMRFSDAVRRAMEESGFWDKAETVVVPHHTVMRLRERCR